MWTVRHIQTYEQKQTAQQYTWWWEETAIKDIITHLGMLAVKHVIHYRTSCELFCG